LLVPKRSEIIVFFILIIVDESPDELLSLGFGLRALVHFACLSLLGVTRGILTNGGTEWRNERHFEYGRGGGK
jgi:hypothetical protein